MNPASYSEPVTPRSKGRFEQMMEKLDKTSIDSGDEVPLDLRESRPSTSQKNRRVLKKVHRNLNVNDIHNIQSDIQTALMEEHQQLVDDSNYVRKCIEEELSFESQQKDYIKTQAETEVPSLRELKDFSSKLEVNYIISILIFRNDFCKIRSQ
jgi:hypothetical protein